MTTVQPGRYRHYKGKEYTVLGVALHSETQEELVVYRQEYGEHGLLVRPKQMILETVDIDGQAVPRVLEQYKEGYLRFNPATSPDALANILKDMETLIERKLRMFPDDRRQIVGATVVKVGTKFRIEIASATVE